MSRFVGCAWAGLILATGMVYGAELSIDEEVVVKFGSDTSLIVHDALHTQPAVIFTSVHDDTVAGQTQNEPSTPAMSNWQGVRVMPTAQPDQVQINGLSIRYADVGLSGLQQNYIWNDLSLMHNRIGVHIGAGSSARLNRFRLLNNQIGMEVDQSTPFLQQSMIVGNTQWGVQNQTPTLSVNAHNNWWGHASGPLDPTGNPSGQGDRVSAGVEYTTARTQLPLIDCRIAPADGRYQTQTREIQLALHCINAVEFRIAEAERFAELPWRSMQNVVPYTLLDTPEPRTLWVEYRSAAGETMRASTRDPVERIAPADVTPPAIQTLQWNGVALVDDALITQVGWLSAQIVEESPGVEVRVTLNGQELDSGQYTEGVFRLFLDFDEVADGTHTLAIQATDRAGLVTTVTRRVQVRIPVPDAPVITQPRASEVIYDAFVAVVGTATPGAQIQLHIDGVAEASWHEVNFTGYFSASASVSREGVHRVRAVARNRRGTSALSAEVDWEYRIPAPELTIVSPAEFSAVRGDTLLAAQVVQPGAVRHLEFFINDVLLGTDATAPYEWMWSTTGLLPGEYTLRVQATASNGVQRSQTQRIVLEPPTPAEPPFEAPYVLASVQVEPRVSYGDRPIVIRGQMVDRITRSPQAFAPIHVVLRSQSASRVIEQQTNAEGRFNWTYTPQPEDQGVYDIDVVHPRQTTYGSAAQMLIQRLSFDTEEIQLQAARGVSLSFPVQVRAGGGEGETGVRMVLRAEDQPSGRVPAGISLSLPASEFMAAQSLREHTLILDSNTAAPESGILILALLAEDSQNQIRDTLRIEFDLYTASPAWEGSRQAIQAGVRQNQIQYESMHIQNQGFVPATQVRVQLQAMEGGAAVPAWASISSASNLGTLEVGQRAPIELRLAPDARVSDGVYHWQIVIESSNTATLLVPVSVSITAAEDGSVRFKIVDIYTNTLGADGVRIPGVAGARVSVQNEAVSSIQAQGVSNTQGEVTLGPLPVGRYTYRVSSQQRNDVAGRFIVQPGVTVDERVFLDFNAVSIQWSVVETTIRDRYDIILRATYQAQVPAPVILVEPMMINIPHMQLGETQGGEVQITNYGLVRADHVRFTPTASDPYYRIEFLDPIPEQLQARQRVRLRYRITALSALPEAEAKSNTCQSYANQAQLQYDFECAAGDSRSSAASLAFNRTYGNNCTAGAGGGTPQQYGGRCWGTGPGCGDVGGYPPGGDPEPPSEGCIGTCGPHAQCCDQQGASPGGGGGSPPPDYFFNESP
jgi:hypothetical protein